MWKYESHLAKNVFIHVCAFCSSAARVLRGVPVFVVWPRENVSALPLHCYRDAAMLEGRHHLSSFPDLLSLYSWSYAPWGENIWLLRVRQLCIICLCSSCAVNSHGVHGLCGRFDTIVWIYFWHACILFVLKDFIWYVSVLLYLFEIVMATFSTKLNASQRITSNFFTLLYVGMKRFLLLFRYYLMNTRWCLSWALFYPVSTVV